MDCTTVVEAARQGANVIVAGTAILGAKEPGEAMRTMRAAVEAVSKA